MLACSGVRFGHRIQTRKAPAVGCGPAVSTGATPSGWWEMSVAAPAPALHGHVMRYVGYREHAVLPVRRRELPTGLVSLIVSFGPSIRVVNPACAAGGQELTSFVAAVGGRFAETEYLGDQYGVQIDLTPLAAGMILGTRMGQVGTRPLDLVEALGPEGQRLVERLVCVADWQSRFAALDVFLTGRLGRAHAPSPAAAWAWARLRESQGRISVGALAEQQGCSTRYFSGQVRAHVGVGPKLLARVLRLQHAIRLLDADNALAVVAARCGYADQAHFGREFREIAGVSPGVWARTGGTQITSPLGSGTSDLFQTGLASLP